AIFVRRAPRLAFVGHTLAEQIERRGDALRVERTHRRQSIVEDLAGDEPLGEPFGETVVADEPIDARLIRQIEKRGAKHQSRTTCEVTGAGFSIRTIGKSACDVSTPS